MDIQEKLFLRSAQASGEIDLYDLHRRYLISPAGLFFLIDEYSKRGIISIHKDKDFNIICNLTDKGFKWLFQIQRELYSDKSDKFWKKIPSNLKCDKLQDAHDYEPTEKDIEIFLGTST